MAKTVSDILQQVHRIYEGDVDYLEFEDDDTQLNFGYLLDGIDEWKNRFPDATVTTPTGSSSVIDVARPFFLTAYILTKLYAEDDTDKAREYEVKMNEEERLEKVAQAMDEDSPAQIPISGAGMSDTSLSEVDITSGS